MKKLKAMTSKKIRPVFDRAIRKRMQEHGLSRSDALLAYRATMKAIGEFLLDGKPVHFYGIGMLHWRLRRGRKMKGMTSNLGGKPFVIPAHEQKDSYHLKWVTSKPFAQRLKGITPVTFLKPLPRPKKQLKCRQCGQLAMAGDLQCEYCGREISK